MKHLRKTLAYMMATRTQARWTRACLLEAPISQLNYYFSYELEDLKIGLLSSNYGPRATRFWIIDMPNLSFEILHFSFFLWDFLN